MTDETTISKRPSSITLVSSFAILGGILQFYYMFRTGVQDFGIENTIIFAAGGSVWIVCGIGFRLMRKWAVYLCAVFALVDQAYLVLTGKWNLLSFILFAIAVFVGFKNLSKMS